MNAERIIRIIGGGFILLFLSPGVAGSPLFRHRNWLWFTAFVGLNLFRSGFATCCPPNNIPAEFGIKEGSC